MLLTLDTEALKERLDALLLESHNFQSFTTYDQVEQEFNQLLMLDNLDQQIELHPNLIRDFEASIAVASRDAYGGKVSNSEIALRFLQRVLYRLNRLNLFWYDDLQNYKNERSVYLNSVRDRIESSWQEWEMTHLDIASIEQLNSIEVKQALMQRTDRDLHPPLSSTKHYLREEMNLEGYQLLLAIASLDGLVEASRLSRIVGGASNEIQATLVRVLLEEYGNGRLARKHSTFFAQMMAELNLNTQPEGYFDIVPWQVLASINHNFLLTERKRYFLRYNGGLTYFEIAGPSIYGDYMVAASRLRLSDAAMGYWELHIREDERHGQWMLTDVAFPLVDRYPNDAWELVLGYDQEKFMGDRASEVVIDLIQKSSSTLRENL